MEKRILDKIKVRLSGVRSRDEMLDINPGFPESAGRTPLAKVRTFLADRRTLLAFYRTSFAKGRTGLAFLRTGISSITIATLLARVFGYGWLAVVEALLLAAGVVMAVDGLIWYVDARKTGKNSLSCRGDSRPGGTTILEVINPGDCPDFQRTEPVKDADLLRGEWSSLTPVQRRRFLANDRTDLAEERTVLACFRTVMARARTGLAFTRTGIAFTGLGMGLLRQFNKGAWTIFDVSLIVIGAAMTMEGFYWYLPGRRAGKECKEAICREEDKTSIWDLVFPPSVFSAGLSGGLKSSPPVRASHSPGIWATTGLALERTVLAERRNVMARLRTVMARSRTGLSFIRTGMSIFSVGAALQVYFGAGNLIWSAFNFSLLAIGVLFIADGLYWYQPSERIRRQYPYCFADLEIAPADYGKPNSQWKKAVFSHDDI